MLKLFDTIVEEPRYRGQMKCPICGVVSSRYCWDCDAHDLITTAINDEKESEDE